MTASDTPDWPTHQELPRLLNEADCLAWNAHNDGEHRLGHCLDHLRIALEDSSESALTAARARIADLEREHNALQGAYSSMLFQRDEGRARIEQLEGALQVERAKTLHEVAADIRQWTRTGEGPLLLEEFAKKLEALASGSPGAGESGQPDYTKENEPMRLALQAAYDRQLEAESGPARDETKPPPGWCAGGVPGTFMRIGHFEPAEAWAIYDRERTRGASTSESTATSEPPCAKCGGSTYEDGDGATRCMACETLGDEATPGEPDEDRSEGTALTAEEQAYGDALAATLGPFSPGPEPLIVTMEDLPLGHTVVIDELSRRDPQFAGLSAAKVIRKLDAIALELAGHYSDERRLREAAERERDEANEARYAANRGWAERYDELGLRAAAAERRAEVAEAHVRTLLNKDGR